MFRFMPLLTLLALGACSARGLDNERLNAFVAAHNQSLDACYEAALKKEGSKDKMLGTAFLVIAPSGKVTSVDITGKLPLPGLRVCLEDTLASWQFPEASGKTRTSLPLIFEPRVVPAPTTP